MLVKGREHCEIGCVSTSYTCCAASGSDGSLTFTSWVLFSFF